MALLIQSQFAVPGLKRPTSVSVKLDKEKIALAVGLFIGLISFGTLLYMGYVALHTHQQIVEQLVKADA